MSYLNFCEKCHPVSCKDAACPYGRILRRLTRVCQDHECRLIYPNGRGNNCHAVDCPTGEAVRKLRRDNNHNHQE